jgi:hypothetical protein
MGFTEKEEGEKGPSVILKGADDGGWHTELLGLWNFSIVRNSR